MAHANQPHRTGPFGDERMGARAEDGGSTGGHGRDTRLVLHREADMGNRPLDSVYAHLDSLASRSSPSITPSTSFPYQVEVPFWTPLADDNPNFSHSPAPYRRFAPNHSSSIDSIVHAPPDGSHPFDFPNASPPHSFDSHFAISLRDALADPRTRSIPSPSPASTSTPSLHIPLPFVSDEPYSRRSISTAPSSPSSVTTHSTGLSMVSFNQPVPDSDDEDEHSVPTPDDSPPLVPNSSSQPITGLSDPALWLLGIVVELWIDRVSLLQHRRLGAHTTGIRKRKRECGVDEAR